jgi:hypothetical protein
LSSDFFTIGLPEKKVYLDGMSILSNLTSETDDDKEADNFDEEYIMAAERDFKHHARPTKDNFEKLLEVVCPNNTYTANTSSRTTP